MRKPKCPICPHTLERHNERGCDVRYRGGSQCYCGRRGKRGKDKPRERTAIGKFRERLLKEVTFAKIRPHITGDDELGGPVIKSADLDYVTSQVIHRVRKAIRR